MNKLLILLMFVSTGCAYKPLLQKDRCYAVVLHNVHVNQPATEMSSFKIEDIQGTGDSQRYILSNLLHGGVAPSVMYYAQAKEFDRHLGSVAELFWTEGGSDTCSGIPSKEELEANADRLSPSHMRRSL